jgi:hypothetical protein
MQLVIVEKYKLQFSQENEVEIKELFIEYCRRPGTHILLGKPPWSGFSRAQAHPFDFGGQWHLVAASCAPAAQPQPWVAIERPVFSVVLLASCLLKYT